MSDLPGNKPGPWCPAYHKQKDRGECAVRKCKYLQSNRVTQNVSPQQEQDGVPQIDANLNPVGVAKAVVRIGRENYQLHEKCALHCVLYDEPSKLRELPWES